MAELCVVTCNLQEGGGERLAHIADVIRRLQPDAAALQEATSREHAAALARTLGMTVVFGEAANGYHVAWLSRRPIQRSQNHRQPGLSKTLLEIELDWPGGPLRLYTTHLASRHDNVSPDVEAAIVLDTLRPAFDTPQILAGDFNALAPDDPVGQLPPGEQKRGDAADGAPRHAIRSIIDAGYIDCYRAAHPYNGGYTYPSSAPWLRLDYIFVSPRMAAHLHACDVTVSAWSARASDHLPVWAIFQEPPSDG